VQTITRLYIYSYDIILFVGMGGARLKQKRKTSIVLCIFLFITIMITGITILKGQQSKATFERSIKKVIYLTFDDGPTYVITDSLLEILKKENVKATFFVVGKEIEGRELILKKIYDEGHSIGLHTYSHNFKKIYKSTEDFINEMRKTSNKVKEVTGFVPKIIRFPGGSSKRLTASTLDDLHKSNFKIYDWNVNIYDGINPNLSVSQLIKNSQIIQGNGNVAIVLMHCNSNNKNTVKALPEIIRYYKDLRYEFRTITEDTPEYYYRYKK
jgi:peptidoglycan/xylan/chitin deacetylase (PgdA/CDA1 family)